MGEDTVRRTILVGAPVDRAWALFTDALGTWWPLEYTWAGGVLEAIGIEPREGGLCFERGPHGFRCDWGRVLVWEPPRRLVLLWQISAERVPEPDPARASEVEVRFAPAGPDASHVELEHRGFDRHGDGGAGYRAGLDSPEGWTYLLECYAAAAAPG